jgi:hypothetical protein
LHLASTALQRKASFAVCAFLFYLSHEGGADEMMCNIEFVKCFCNHHLLAKSGFGTIHKYLGGPGAVHMRYKHECGSVSIGIHMT